VLKWTLLRLDWLVPLQTAMLIILLVHTLKPISHQSFQTNVLASMAGLVKRARLRFAALVAKITVNVFPLVFVAAPRAGLDLTA
jgi:hypothetical protein